MEEKRRRRFGFGFCCSLFVLVVIVVLGSVLPVVLIPRSIIINETTTTTLVPTTTEGTTTSIVPTTTVVTTTSIVPTTAPIFTPSYFVQSNIVEYSFPKNKFVRMNYTINEYPVSLVVYQESEFGMIDWETKIPCFYNSTPISGFSGSTLTIDTSDQSILVNTRCLNFTTNMTFSYTFKFDTNGNFLWKTQLPASVTNAFPARSIISGNNIFFLQLIPPFFALPVLVKLDKISGIVLNFQNNTYFESFCDTSLSTAFYFHKIENFALMEDNTLFVHLFRVAVGQPIRSFCSVFIDQNYNFIRKTEANYVSNSASLSFFYLNTTDGGHTKYNGDHLMIKYDGNGNLVASFNVAEPAGRIYGTALLPYPLIFYNGFHYTMTGWRASPASIVPYNHYSQLAKYDFINNNVQLGSDIVIASFASFSVYINEVYWLTSPQLFNNSLLFAGYQGKSTTKNQFKQYYQIPITF